MNLFRKSTRPVRGRFSPCVETLEDRCVPATFSFNGATATLTVTSTTGKDAIVITDDGTNNAGAVTVTDNGQTLFTSGPIAGVNEVHTININTLGSHDRVVYDLTGNMVANNRDISATFGNGKGDSFEADVNGNLINSFLLLQANGSNSKADKLTGTVTGSLNGASFLGFLYKGGLGKDVINIDATDSVDIGPLSQLTVAVNGGGGSNLVNVNYEGQLQGAFFLDAFGGSGSSRVNSRVVFDGVSNGLLFGPINANTGQAAAQVRGGGGNDRLSFEVDLSGVLKANSATVIDGGAGINACHAAGFITGIFNCEKTF
jgi:hypothetical protein